jgi:hypothetical protein
MTATAARLFEGAEWDFQKLQRTRQQAFKFADHVPNEPLSQGVISFACKKPLLIQPMMKVFERFAHLTALLRGKVM